MSAGIRYETEEGWYALCVAILKEVTVEGAFAALGGGRTRYTDEDVQDMIRFRKRGMMLRDIGEMYHIGTDTVCKAIKKGEKCTRRNRLTR